MARNVTTFKHGHGAMGGRPTGSLNRTTMEVRELARRLIEDPKYQASLRRRMIAGKAPHMETLLFAYAYGKPVERHEVTATARAAGADGAELRGSEAAEEDHSGTDLILYGGVVTQDGRERLRRLMAPFEEAAKTPEGREWMRRTLAPLAAVDKERAKARAAGELPSATTPPGESA
jgi:hypothetical protein